MKRKSWRCIFRRCENEVIAVNDKYTTTYTDTGKKLNHNMRFYRCVSCGGRFFWTNLSKYETHRGIDEARRNWLEAGVVPHTSVDPREDRAYKKPDEDLEEELSPVLQYQKTLEEISKTLGVVIVRDFDLESKYPRLKKAADIYHRELEKYRNFERLKK